MAQRFHGWRRSRRSRTWLLAAAVAAARHVGPALPYSLSVPFLLVSVPSLSSPFWETLAPQLWSAVSSGFSLDRFIGEYVTETRLPHPQPMSRKRSPWLSASLRQTRVGFTADGPTIGSVRANAVLAMDFFGGIPGFQTGQTMGLPRLLVAFGRIAGQPVEIDEPDRPRAAGAPHAHRRVQRCQRKRSILDAATEVAQVLDFLAAQAGAPQEAREPMLGLRCRRQFRTLFGIPGGAHPPHTTRRPPAPHPHEVSMLTLVSEDKKKALSVAIERTRTVPAETDVYPTPRGARLYAFVEAARPLTESEVRGHIGNAREGLPQPSLIQITRHLPRHPEGELRDDVLRLIAQNQVDLIDGLRLDPAARAAAADLIASRLNRTDRRLRTA